MTIRTIVEEELVAARIDKASVEFPVLVGAYEGLKWRLARDCYCGELVSDNPSRYLVKKICWGPGGKPAITLLYRVEANEIIVEGSKIDFPTRKRN